MTDPFSLSLIIATFLLAGTVKGVIGLGLPTVSLALLTVFFGLPEAMALMLVPSFLTNVWQALVGGQALSVFKRIWPFLLVATGTIWIGGQALAEVGDSYLSALLGALLIVYAVIGLRGLRIALPENGKLSAGLVLGAVNGVLTGMTGSFVVPGVMYLQAVGLDRDQLIQAMGMLFSLSTLGLAVALGGNGLLKVDLGIMSAVALLPAIIGMVLGQKIRKNLSEQSFRKVFFISLMVLGVYIGATALGG